MPSTIGTVRVQDSHLNSTEVADHLHTLIADQTISDRVAITIASWWQSPGPIGNVLASFASGARVDANALHADVMATVRHHALTMGAELDPDDIAELHRLAAWVDGKRSGVRVYSRRFRVVDDGHGGSDAQTIEVTSDFVPAVAEHGDGWHESAARVIADDLRRRGLAFDGATDWAYDEPHTIDYREGIEEEVTAHFEHMRDTDERRVVRMVNYGR